MSDIKHKHKLKAFTNFQNGIIFTITNLQQALIVEQNGACAIMLAPMLDTSVLIKIKSCIRIPIIYKSGESYKMYYQHNIYPVAKYKPNYSDNFLDIVLMLIEDDNIICSIRDFQLNVDIQKAKLNYASNISSLEDIVLARQLGMDGIIISPIVFDEDNYMDTIKLMIITNLFYNDVYKLSTICRTYHTKIFSIGE